MFAYCIQILHFCMPKLIVLRYTDKVMPLRKLEIKKLCSNASNDGVLPALSLETELSPFVT